MAGLGTTEILIILAVVLLLFGSTKLPQLARSLGKSARILKAETKGLHDDEDDKSDKSGESAQAGQGDEARRRRRGSARRRRGWSARRRPETAGSVRAARSARASPSRACRCRTPAGSTRADPRPRPRFLSPNTEPDCPR